MPQILVWELFYFRKLMKRNIRSAFSVESYVRVSSITLPVEKEALALITAVRAFSVYFGAQMATVYTDHSPLQYLQTMRKQNAKLTRWCLELQQYSILIQHRAGKD